MKRFQALTLSSESDEVPLSPFFARCRWVAFLDLESGGVRRVQNRLRSAEFLVERILAEMPGRLICGFIDARSARRLRDSGIDLRLGPCSVPARRLVHEAWRLPAPKGLVAAEIIPFAR